MRYARKISQLLLVTAAVFSCVATAQESAGSYPSRLVTVINPFAPGGAVDRDTRLYIQKLSESFGKPFVMDYKSGAGTTIGTGYVAKAAADGYTLLSVTSTFSVNPAIYTKLNFDTERDIAPVSHMYSRAAVLVVHPSFPARNWQEYVAYVKANPGKVNFGTAGGGSIYHIGGAWLHSEIGAKATFVHYKGAGPIMLDIVAGTIDAFPPTVATALPQVKAGKLRVIANMSAARSPLLPDMRTIAEQGLPGFDFTSWGGILTTGGTPAAIINKLSNELAKIAKSPDVLQIAATDGTLMIGSTPEAFQKLIATEIVRWKKVVQENNIRLEE